jgi:hypothetical protein
MVILRRSTESAATTGTLSPSCAGVPQVSKPAVSRVSKTRMPFVNLARPAHGWPAD